MAPDSAGLYTHTHAHTHACTHTRTHVHTHTYTHTVVHSCHANVNTLHAESHFCDITKTLGSAGSHLFDI